jgi:ElaB/YqjD/DUF883 family membrane-anchored ribosome-binding protein
MIDKADESSREPEQIEQEIHETRTAITQKLEALEEKVRDTVQNAKETVEETITTVTSSVQDTVETVKRTFDLPLQVQNHPWPMVGASVLLGFAAGGLLGKPRRHAPTPWRGAFNGAQTYRPLQHQYIQSHEAGAGSPAAASSGGPSAVSHVLDLFADELQTVKGLAIGFLLSKLRDTIKDAIPPQLKQDVDHMMNNITTKLGGKPVPETHFRTGEYHSHQAV